VLGDTLQKHIGPEAFAHEPAEGVGEAHDDSIDGPGADQRFEFLQVHDQLSAM
jgi:hypothetical protein